MEALSMFSKLLAGGLLALMATACSDAATTRVGANGEEISTTQADEADGTFEFAQSRAHRTPRRIERFDANKDGVLQASEVPARLHDWFVAVDANKDNVVTADEIRAYNKAHPHPHGQHHNGQHQHQQGQQQPAPQHTSETTL
jgi:hypothetical protein